MPTKTQRLGRWLTQPANLTFAVALAGIIFTLLFWAITNRFEPTFVATFGTMLTASGLLAGRSQSEPERPLPAEPTAPPLSNGDGK